MKFKQELSLLLNILNMYPLLGSKEKIAIVVKIMFYNITIMENFACLIKGLIEGDVCLVLHIITTMQNNLNAMIQILKAKVQITINVREHVNDQ